MAGRVVLIPHELLLVSDKDTGYIVEAFKKIENFLLKKAEMQNG